MAEQWICGECGAAFGTPTEVQHTIWTKAEPTVRKTVCTRCHHRLTRNKQIAKEAKVIEGRSLYHG